MTIYIGGGKKFGFEHPFQFYEKLEWEYEQVMKSGFATGKEISFHFMNFAITAWHMTDWTFPHLQKDFLSKLQGGETKAAFTKWTKERCRPLAACNMIANTCKHFANANHDDPRIQILAKPSWDHVLNETPMRHMMQIIIDGKMQGLDEFARDVLTFWQWFLESQELFPE